MDPFVGVAVTLAGLATALYGPVVVDRFLRADSPGAPSPEARTLRAVGLLVAIYGAMSLALT
jgi:hypothetical protein